MPLLQNSWKSFQLQQNKYGKKQVVTPTLFMILNDFGKVNVTTCFFPYLSFQLQQNKYGKKQVVTLTFPKSFSIMNKVGHRSCSKKMSIFSRFSVVALSLPLSREFSFGVSGL